MFNKNFYPTPHDLVCKMVQGIDAKFVNSVLEPSAGKGDLADGIKKQLSAALYYNHQFEDIDCIEIEPELQHILKGKKYRVIHDDFLTFDTLKQYDLIIMNPPFDDGDKHLLKAIEMQKNGGKVICLLNAETLRNPYSNTRKELARQLDDLKAEIEYVQNTFLDAERKTGVEIAIVKINIEKKVFESRILDNLRQEVVQERIEMESRGGQVARFGADNFIDMIVEQYQFEIKAGLNLIREYNAMQPLLMDKVKRGEKHGYGTKCILKLGIGDKELTVNNFIKEVRYKYWDALFNNPNFTGSLTDNLRKMLYNKLDELKNFDFSVYNIMTIQQELMVETVKGVEETIIALFDDLSIKSYWDETSKNIHYFNGWRTNKSWKINQKVIILLQGFGRWDATMDYCYTVTNKLEEMTKVFDYLDSGRTQYVDIKAQLKEAQDKGISVKIPLKYFRVTFYKKGTAHIEFTDLELLNKFNLFGCLRKGWLPPHYGKKRYKDMNVEEKEIVREFSGDEAEYNKIIARQDFYLPETKSFVPLLAMGK
jgi:hypothetical protein